MTIIWICGCSLEKKPQNHWTSQNLKGRVKTLTEETFNGVMKFGEFQKQDLAYGIIKIFDIKGNMLEDNSYGPNNIIKSYAIFKYDDMGNQIGVKFGNNKIKWEIKSSYILDAKGNKIEKNNYGSYGEMISKSKYKYDSKSNLVEEKIYDTNGSLFNTRTFKYDGRGSLVEEENLGLGDSKHTYKYDSKGNLIESISITTEKFEYKFTYIVDDKGNVIEETYYTSSENFPHKTTYQYQYDSIGNWIKKDTFNGDIQTGTIERKIEYYK